MTVRDKVLKAYDLLATDDVALHMQGLNLLDEARAEDHVTAYAVENEIDQHKVLQVTAKKKGTYIYLSDESGHLVQQDKGEMFTSVKPGTYYLQFGRDGEKIKLDLTKDRTFKE